MLFHLVLFSVLSTETAQTWLAQKATKYLNETLGLNAKVEGVKISITKDIELRDVYVADDHNDTLIFVGNLKFHFNGFSNRKKLLKTSSVKLNNGKLYLRKHPEDEVFNFQKFLNKLASDSSDSTQSANSFQWKSSTVEIDSMKFIKHRIGCEDSCTNIFIDYSKLSIKDFHLNGGEVDANIKSFTYVDRYRFDLIRLSGKASFHSDYIQAEDIEMQTEQTTIRANARLEYSSLKTLGYFVDSVQIDADIKEAIVSSEEFISWLPTFPDFGLMEASGKVTGTVNDLNGKEITANFGKSSFNGNCIVKNATHSQDIFIEATGIDFKAYVDDYEQYIFPISGYGLPENFRELKFFELKGNYIGDLNDITLEGKIKTQLGGGYSNIKLSNVRTPDHLKYNGVVDLKDFNIGKFIQQEDIGYVSVKGSIDGKGTNAETLDFKGDLDIAYLDISNYRLQNIFANGTMKDSVFNGQLTVKDKNLKGDFRGLIDFNSVLQHYDFSLSLKHADLFKLGISKDTIAVLTSNFSVDIEFQDINNFKGELDISDITFSEKNNFFFFDSIAIHSVYANERHLLNLNSQLLDMSLEGQFDIDDVIPSLNKISGNYFKFYSPELEKELSPLDFDYTISLKNTDLLTLLFVEDLEVESGTELNGYLRMPSEQFQLELTSPEIKYAESKFDQLSLILKNDLDSSEVDLKVGRFDYDNVVIDSNHIALHIISDSVDFKINAIVRDSIDSPISVAGHSIRGNKDFYELNLRRSTFNVGSQYFHIKGDNKISWYKEFVTVENIYLISEESDIAINGKLSKNRNEILRFSFDSLNVNILNYFIGDENTRLSGFMNGDIMIGEVFAKPKIYSLLRIDTLLVNNDWVGDVFVDSDYNYELERFEFESKIQRGKLPAFNLKGFFVPGEEGEIDAIANFDKFRVNSLSPLLSGVLEDLKGTVTGSLILNGPLAKPHFNGSLTLNKVGMKVPLMQTYYNFVGPQNVQIVDTAFILPKINFVDSKEGTKGTVYGSINHKGFDDFYFDIKIDAKNLLAMDLEKGENKYFFGKAYATGTMKIVGPIEEMLLDMTIKTEKNTDFKMPISGDLEVERSKFVTFTEPFADFSEVLLEDPKIIDLRGLTLKLKVQVTTDAQTELIMDETVGDIISGVGKGELRIEMKPNGELAMFGDYELEKGDYLFTMRNIINKPFVLEPGGKLNWKGDPYNAQIDLRAKYSTRTVISTIVTAAPENQRATVDLYLILKGQLMNPTISFEIELPGVSSAWQDELRSKLTNVDRLNQQAFSILVLNMFWNEDPATQTAGSGLAANSVQVLSNQFSNWINAGTKDFIDVNMNYSTGTTSEQYDELEIGISKGFYDDRIIVNGILDVPMAGGSTAAQESKEFAGDVEVLYKITKDGRIKVKAFNRNNQNNPARANDDSGNYTQGVGIQYQKDFNAWGPFLKQFFSFKKEPEVVVENEED